MTQFVNLLLTTLIFFSVNTWAAKETTIIASDFSLQGQDGKTYKLSEVLKEGQHVVLEWFNNECPYVKKHYDSGNMQALQKKYTEKGVKWFSIASSAKGKQGYLETESANKVRADRKQLSTAILLDSNGEVGKLYGAKTTPHMFVINPKGELIYSGAIDSDSSYRSESIKEAKNYVAQVLDASLKGKKVVQAPTSPYGCSVKY